MSKADQSKELNEEYSEEEPFKEESDEEFKNQIEIFLNPKFDLAALTNAASEINTEVVEPLIAEMLANIANNQRTFNSEHWEPLRTNCIEIEQLLQRMEHYLKEEKIDPVVAYAHRRTWHDLQTKIFKLYEYKEQEDLKPVHLIFMFVHDAQKIEELITKLSLDVNEKDSDDTAAAHFAAQFGNEQGLELLIDKYKFDASTQDKSIGNILHYAAAYGHVDLLIKILNNYNIDINSKNHDGNTCVHIALFSEYNEILATLLEKGADATITNDDLDPLSYATAENNLNALKLLINHLQEKHEFNVDKINSLGHTLLYYAAHGNHGYGESVVDYLTGELHANPDIDHVDLAGAKANDDSTDKCILS